LKEGQFLVLGDTDRLERCRLVIPCRQVDIDDCTEFVPVSGPDGRHIGADQWADVRTEYTLMGCDGSTPLSDAEGPLVLKRIVITEDEEKEAIGLRLYQFTVLGQQ
jgi:hypothetical protein